MGLLKSLIKLAVRPTANKIKGKIGEKKVIKKIESFFSGIGHHHLINNYTLIDEKGRSHQMDHIVIKDNGIFCIETKNIKGTIYGNPDSQYWTQVLGFQKFKFLNPIKQNMSHIYQLRKIFNDQYFIYSVIVFVNNNGKSLNIPSVIDLKDLSRYLNRFQSNTILNEQEMEEIYNILISSASELTNKEHVKSIRTTQKEIKKGICPRCGGQLVLRTGKYGKFYGCSNYPNCTFVLK